MNKELLIDKVLRNFIKKHLYEASLVVIILVALLIRVQLLPNTELSPDYNTYYREWVEFYRGNGGLAGLSSAPGDYYVPFNVIYALCSYLPCEPWIPLGIIPFICEIISAFFIYKILFLLTGRKHHSAFAGVMTLFLPFVMFNGALWKQVDAVYTCFLMISLYYVLKQSYRAAIIWYAVSFSFKLQAVFFLPLFIILYITEGYESYDRVARGHGNTEGFSILEFLWIPVIYLVAGLPEVIAGHGLRATYFAYLTQTGELQSEGYGMVSYLPNIYNFGLDDYDSILSLVAIMILLAVLAIAATVCFRYRNNMDRSLVVLTAIWTAWTCLVLLPGMHERYDYAMILLLTPYAVMCMKKLLWPTIMANACSLMVYGIVLFRAEILNMQVISVIYLAAYLMTTIIFIRELSGGNQSSEA